MLEPTGMREERGLPSDSCAQLRSDLENAVNVSWVSWAELDAIDPATTPDHYLGRLRWRSSEHPWVTRQAVVHAEWQPEVIDQAGPPPPAWTPHVDRMEWKVGNRDFEYERLTAGTVLGADNQWVHVFAVMKALAGRFGDDGVRLVVGFD